MTGITSAISNLISSIFSVFTGILSTILSSVQGLFAVVATLLKDVVALSEGLVHFLLSNIVIIGLLAAVVVGYSAFQQKQGKTVASKKTI